MAAAAASATPSPGGAMAPSAVGSGGFAAASGSAGVPGGASPSSAAAAAAAACGGAATVAGLEPILLESGEGDIPGARFGHTTTYMGNNTVILFGGAVGDTGKYLITNDTYQLNLATFEWTRLTAENAPSARAAHAATCVDCMQFVVYGGAAGGGSLSTDELYLLDLRRRYSGVPLTWLSVPITGVTPGRRYGHSIAYHEGGVDGGVGGAAGAHKANLIIFGGNDGTRTLCDVWYMDVKRAPFTWHEVVLPTMAKQPSPRVYHSAEICTAGPAFGMMVLFGGRSPDGRSLKDTWGLRQHRDGRWDWVDAPIKKGAGPDPRFQHTCVFFGSKMVIVGGRDADVSKALPTAVYDTETCEWRSLPSVSRFRHSAWAHRPMLYTFGGFDHRSQSQPTADIQVLHVTANINFYSDKERADMRRKGLPLPWEQPLQKPSSATAGPPDESDSAAAAAAASYAANAAAGLRTPNPYASINRDAASIASMGPLVGMRGAPGVAGAAVAVRPNEFGRQSAPPVIPAAATSFGSPSAALGGSSARGASVRLANHVFSKTDYPNNPDFSSLVRKISIDRLGEEGRKLRSSYNSAAAVADSGGAGGLLQPVNEVEDPLADEVLRKLLRPNVTPGKMERDFNSNDVFCLAWDTVSQLAGRVLDLVAAEPMVLNLRAPIKVYGDVHGQFYDLMRLFGSYKAPVEEFWAEENAPFLPRDIIIHGDIDSLDYLFLGDYVDRGTHSLEVICLLFALKCKYPRQIHLIRGNHEDRAINGAYGFSEECRRRLREDPTTLNSCWLKFNQVFDCLPVGALIENRIMCIHGGIGGTINNISDITSLKRPLTVCQMPRTEDEQKVTDLLWSDPTDNDAITGVIQNVTRDQDGTGRIVKFGPDRVADFLQRNNLDLIVRAHECVMDGFERFAGGKLITLFSATDYCGHRNAGALLFIRRDLTVVPKVIYPQDRESAQLGGSTWLPTVDSRPPTPPRSIRREKDLDLGF